MLQRAARRTRRTGDVINQISTSCKIFGFSAQTQSLKVKAFATRLRGLGMAWTCYRLEQCQALAEKDLDRDRDGLITLDDLIEFTATAVREERSGLGSCGASLYDEHGESLGDNSRGLHDVNGHSEQLGVKSLDAKLLAAAREMRARLRGGDVWAMLEHLTWPLEGQDLQHFCDSLGLELPEPAEGEQEGTTDSGDHPHAGRGGPPMAAMVRTGSSADMMIKSLQDDADSTRSLLNRKQQELSNLQENFRRLEQEVVLAKENHINYQRGVYGAGAASEKQRLKAHVVMAAEGRQNACCFDRPSLRNGFSGSWAGSNGPVGCKPIPLGESTWGRRSSVNAADASNRGDGRPRGRSRESRAARGRSSPAEKRKSSPAEMRKIFRSPQRTLCPPEQRNTWDPHKQRWVSRKVIQ
ncbi:unnamed protein product [Chrysoparadoxa australica]